MISIKNLFSFRAYIQSISEHKIDSLLILYIILIAVTTSVVGLFLFEGDGLNLLQKTIEPLNTLPPSERLAGILAISRGMLLASFTYLAVYGVIVVAANWIFQNILKVFKRQITLKKMINLSLYVILLQRFAVLCLVIVIGVLQPFRDLYNGIHGVAILMLMFWGLKAGALVVYGYGIRVLSKSTT